MKKLNKLAIVALMFYSQLNFAQTATMDEQVHVGSGLVNAKKTTSEKATGSQYFIDAFLPASISGSTTTYLVRYNAYTDQIEVKSSNDEVRPLIAKKDVLVATSDKKNTFEYVDYTSEKDESHTGYLNLISNNSGVKIYSRMRIYLQPESHPSNGYESYKPAMYKKSSVEYYIKTKDGGIVYMPSKKKELAKLFLGKDKEINDFIKTNKISLSDEQDLKKLGEFLNTLL